MAQTTTESATWSTTAHGRSRDQTFRAPEKICPMNRATASVESRITSRDRSAMVRARIATHRTIKNTPAAKSRCRNIAVAAPPSAGTKRPFISGQSVNASPADFART